MRLAKFLAHAGVASRRASELLIAEGRITVDGRTATDPALDVGEHNDVRYDGDRIRGAEQRVVYALNKPAGVVSTASDTHGRRTVTDLVPQGLRLYPVGRLDADSTGLILLTNDGELANRLTHPRYEVPKTYRATVKGPSITDRALRQLREGVRLEDGLTSPARVQRLSGHVLEITIHEGKKRQVRRMCDAVGHPVRALVRVQFGPLRLGELQPGRSRRLTAREIRDLAAAAHEPAGTA
ncbi:pseudouridine synthase [Conexibacter sp. JD483]|uniref:pseudouridine synthase n=1 Tax=unclassified Conexibacter TaxID=2627773 RepID=UPI0027292D8D|nr:MULTISPECIES: pseudouridine synthase [unclassified Conexibacter]MDO8184590.1 pseudouridine synthase [Conexibacter sp. CPCC 205706]MDO8197896.1 pseudouridine synthase [Conexibacter sp. CPCC 205762]MDR9370139.1 pseudouridine synthase [Conexibacter sp. JD483]